MKSEKSIWSRQHQSHLFIYISIISIEIDQRMSFQLICIFYIGFPGCGYETNIKLGDPFYNLYNENGTYVTQLRNKKTMSTG